MLRMLLIGLMIYVPRCYRTGRLMIYVPRVMNMTGRCRVRWLNRWRWWWTCIPAAAKWTASRTRWGPIGEVVRGLIPTIISTRNVRSEYLCWSLCYSRKHFSRIVVAEIAWTKTATVNRVQRFILIASLIKIRRGKHINHFFRQILLVSLQFPFIKYWLQVWISKHVEKVIVTDFL